MLDLPIGSYLLPDADGTNDRIERVNGVGPRGEAQWAVRGGGMVLSRALEWDHEPLPSSSLRTREWYRQHRFDSPEEAYAHWLRWSRRVADDGR